jgi:hypothetical protein
VRRLAAEDCPKIEIRVLKRLGLFDPNHAVTECGVESNGHKFLITCRPVLRRLWVSYSYHGKLRRVEIELDQAKLRNGDRIYFYDPSTGERTSTLYLVGDQLASLKTLGLRTVSRRGREAERLQAQIDTIRDRLEGREGFGKARGARRERLVEQLAGLTSASLHKPLEVMALEHRRHVRAKRPWRSRQGEGPTSTVRALAAGDAATLESERELFEAIVAPTLAVFLSATGPDRCAPTDPDSPILIVEDQPALDLRALGRHWDLTKASLHWAKLVWPSNLMGGARHFLLVLDMTTPPPLLLVQRFHDAEPVSSQTIMLVKSASSVAPRWQMVCPASGAHCDILYLRDGRFASAKAQRLTHRSQRAAKAPLLGFN